MLVRNATQREVAALSTKHTSKGLAAAPEATLMERLSSNPHTVLQKDFGLKVPGDRKIHLVDESAGDVVFRVPSRVSAARHRPGFREAPPASPEASFVQAVSTTVHHYTGSIWPVGYKGNDRFDFVVPDGAMISEIRLLADPEEAHRGARMSIRPDDGSGPGAYSVHVHWWINAYQEVYYSVLVNLTRNGNGDGGFQLGSRYEISGFLHIDTNWQPVSPEPGYGDETQVIFTHLE